MIVRLFMPDSSDSPIGWTQIPSAESRADAFSASARLGFLSTERLCEPY